MKRKKNRKVIKPFLPFTWFVRWIVPKIWKKHFSLKIDDPDNLCNFEPPYIIIANHVNFWDPIFINKEIPYVIQNVTSDNIFRTKMLLMIMKLVGSIPKTKFMPDIEAIGNIIRVLQNKGIIGIYPEARRTWDGKSIPIMDSVPKLIQKLKVPVIAAKLKGGYLAKPRWAKNTRKCEVEVSYSKIFDGNDLRDLSLEEVHQRLSNAITHSEAEYQRKERKLFIADDPAEYLEKVLFFCPNCEKIDTLHSSGAQFYCTSCDYAVELDDYGFFRPKQGPLRYDNTEDWNEWQLDMLKNYISEKSKVPEKGLFKSERATIYTGYRTNPLKKLCFGKVTLLPNGIQLKSATASHNRFFELSKIDGINVQNKEMLEFYYHLDLFRIDFSNIRSSAYKWFKSVQLLNSSS